MEARGKELIPLFGCLSEIVIFIWFSYYSIKYSVAFEKEKLWLKTCKNSIYYKIYLKELSLCHKLCFSKPYIFGFQCRKP